MTDAEYEVAKARLDPLIDKWLEWLGLKWWDITTEYVREAFKVDGGDASDTLASCSAKWEYARATLCWNMPSVAASTDDYLENVVVHELCHILVNELREEGMKHEERVCSMLQKAFCWVRDYAKQEQEAGNS